MNVASEIALLALLYLLPFGVAALGVLVVTRPLGNPWWKIRHGAHH